MVAVKHGHLSVWLLVKKYRAECNVHDIDGFTPLHYAATRQVGIVKFYYKFLPLRSISLTKRIVLVNDSYYIRCIWISWALLNAGADIHHLDWNKILLSPLDVD